jgi:ubiquinone/menaquinone biosynthesis C-methylase UbiE
MRKVVDRLLEVPAVYAAWQAPFAAQKFAPVDRALRDRPARRVLDVGCGPGTNAARFATADYVGVDINEEYLEIARSKFKGTFIAADLESVEAEALGQFDTILVNSVLHHLSDATVHRLLAQLTRRLGPEGRVHVLELVLPPRPTVARLMARLDRGKFPRPLADWRNLLGAHFAALTVEPYTLGPGLWDMVYFQGTAK